MIRKIVMTCAALVGASTASAARFGETEILKSADGSVWYLEDSTVKPFTLNGGTVYAFFVRSDSAPSLAVRHWSARIYLHCPTKWFVRSIVAGYDANDNITSFATKGWARTNWEKSDPSGVVAAAAKIVCPAS